MEIKKATGKEWDNWYDKQCKGKEREFKTALKVIGKGNDEDRRNKCCNCGKECVKRLDELKRVAGIKINRGELLEWKEMWNENLQYRK